MELPKLDRLFRLINIEKRFLFSLAILCIAIFFAGYFNRNYLLFSYQVGLGLVLIPFIIKPQINHQGNFRYAVLFLFFLALALFLNLQLFLFFAWGSLVLFIVEFYIGKIGFLPLFFLLSISPALYYVVNIFSFPIRLYLSEITCYLFNLAGFQITNKGSYFVLESGFEFHVDQACVGLKMFGSGLIAAVIILAFKQRQLKDEIAFQKIVFWLLIMLLLLVLSNLLRIMGLVFFKSMPGSLSHQVIGVLALLLYSILPFYVGVKYLFKNSNIEYKKRENTLNGGTYLPIILLLIGIGSSIKFDIDRKDIRRDIVLEELEIPGFVKNEKEDGVMEFKNDSLLLYIKPAIKPFEGGHPPQICWRASGFELCNFEKLHMGNHTYMVGTLKKNKQQQFTIWWYDNGTYRTINEWEWRQRSETPFRVINICSKDSISVINLLKSGFSIPNITSDLSQVQ